MNLRQQVLLGMTPDERLLFMLKSARLHVEQLDKHVRDSGLIGGEAREYRRLLLKGFKPAKARREVEKWRKADATGLQ